MFILFNQLRTTKFYSNDSILKTFLNTESLVIIGNKNNNNVNLYLFYCREHNTLVNKFFSNTKIYYIRIKSCKGSRIEPGAHLR